MEKDKIRMVIIGGSAGSLEALLEILPGVKADLAIPVILVLHRKNANDSILTNLLAARCQLAVREIEEKETPVGGTIYIVPPDYHVLFEEDQSFSLDVSEKVNYSRPSIDVVVKSAADVYGAALACILLSGANADGTEGFRYVQEKGGVTIAQSPESAEVSYMPEQAIIGNAVQYVMDNRGIAGYINDLF
jgi:two-component system chemotaxis response regulator CheB